LPHHVQDSVAQRVEILEQQDQQEQLVLLDSKVKVLKDSLDGREARKTQAFLVSRDNQVYKEHLDHLSVRWAQQVRR